MLARRFVFVFALVGAAWAASPDAPRPISAAQFDRLHKLIRPQAGEQRFWKIPWLLSIAEARVKAAAEGKPILIWAGAGGPPIGVC